MKIEKTYIYENGQLTENNPTGAPATDYTYNWDGKLRSGGDITSLKYDPAGNRIYKANSTDSRKYIVDIVGELPVILLEIDTSNSLITKTYIYANAQPLAQHDGDCATPDPIYFYLHDRLGSVRLMIDPFALVKNSYTYNPFGELLETSETVTNPFKFAGQWLDPEISQYYLRARMYDPYISRFTSRDSIIGNFNEPLTLHKYLYCINDPLNKMDPWGLLYTPLGVTKHYNRIWTQHVINAATEIVLKAGYGGMWIAFGAYGDPFDKRYPGLGMFDYAGGDGFTFDVPGCVGTGPSGVLMDNEFGNYLAGYLGYHVGGFGESFTRLLGHIYSDDYLRDSWNSRYWITKGVLDANKKLQQQLRDKVSGHGGGLIDRFKNYFDEHDLGLLKADARRIQWELSYFDAMRMLEEFSQ